MTASPTPAVSIIVPVYKVERYLRQCVDSILAQTFTDWELILVDDGSPDGSGAICDDYAAADSRVRVLHTPNGGLSRARNRALAVARGEYVSFIDSDDWVDLDFIASLHRNIIASGADIAVTGHVLEYVDRSRPSSTERTVTTLSGTDALVALYYDKQIRSFACDKLVKRSIMTEMFPEGMYYEDIFVMIKWFSNAEKVVVATDPYYHYRQRKSSVVNNPDPKLYLDNQRSELRRIEAVLSRPDAIDSATALRYFVKKSLSNAKRLIRRNPKVNAPVLAAMAEIVELMRPHFNAIAPKLPAKLRRRYLAMARHPRLFAHWIRFTANFHTSPTRTSDLYA